MPYLQCAYEKQCFGEDSTPDMSYFTTAISFLLLILNIPGNLLVILAVALDPYKNLRTPFNFLMTNLAVADLVVGTVTEPMSIYIHWMEAKDDHVTLGETRILYMSYFISCTASLLSLGTLAIERYLAIRYPYTYRNKLSTKRVLLTVILIWTLSIALPCVYFEVGYVTYAFIFANTAVVITIGIICFMYYLMYRALKMRARSDTPLPIVGKSSEHENSTPENYHQNIVENGKSVPESQQSSAERQNAASNSQPQKNAAENGKAVPDSHPQNSVKHENIASASPESRHQTSTEHQNAAEESDHHQNNIAGHENATPENHHTHISAKWEHKITKRFLVVLIALLLCYVPSTILIYTMTFCRSCSCTTSHWLRDVQYLFVIANSSVNFFAYALRSSRYRKAFAKILKLKSRDGLLESGVRMADSSTDIMNV